MTKRVSRSEAAVLSGAFSLERVRKDMKELFSRFEVIQRQHELIRKLDRTILRLTSSPRNVLNIIVNEGRRHIESQHAQVAVIRRNRLVIEASTESMLVDRELPLENSLCGKAIRERRNQNCPDVSKLASDNYVRFHKQTKSELVVLVRPERASRVQGLLIFERYKRRAFDEEAVSFAELLANQAAIAIEQARVWKSIDMIHGISAHVFAGEMTLGRGFNQILNTVLEALNFENGQILRHDSGELLIIASSRENDLGLRIGPANSVCGRYLIEEQRRENFILQDIAKTDYAQYYLPLLRGENEALMRSELIVPLVRENRLIGALNLESPQVGAFSEIDEKLLSVVAALIEHAMFATFGRTSRVHQSRIETANLAMTHLGQAAQSFLHRFGNHVGHVRGNLLYLKDIVSTTRGEASAQAEMLIRDLVEKLDEANAVLRDFHGNFNPAGPKFQIQKMDLAEVAKLAVERFARSHPSEVTRIVYVNRLPSEAGINNQIVTGRSPCMLSLQVFEILENILSNAMDAIGEKRRLEDDEHYKGLIQVIVDLPDPLYPRLQIIDNGTGISEEIKSKIFDFGFTTKPRPEGGIGLWFCEYYVTLRGGHIKCKSVQGTGATFEIQFPAAFQDN